MAYTLKCTAAPLPITAAYPPTVSHLHRYLKYHSTNTTNITNTINPPQNIHLSSFALLSTILIVSVLMPKVLPTPYSLRWVPFNSSL